MSQLPSSDGPRSRENEPKPASGMYRETPMRHVVTHYWYGNGGQVLGVARMEVEGSAERLIYTYPDEDAA